MPETFDEWTKELPDGRTVVYTSEIAPETGGVITASVGDIKQTGIALAPMTRQEVEAAFPDL